MIASFFSNTGFWGYADGGPMETRSLLLPSKTPRYHFWTVSGNPITGNRSPSEGQVSFNTERWIIRTYRYSRPSKQWPKLRRLGTSLFSLCSSSLCYSAESVDFRKKFLAHNLTRFTGSTLRWGEVSYNFFGGRWLGEYRARSVQCHVHGSMIDRALIAAAFKWSLSMLAGNFCQVGLDSALVARQAQLRCEWVLTQSQAVWWIKFVSNTPCAAGVVISGGCALVSALVRKIN